MVAKRKRRKLADTTIRDNRIQWQKFVDWYVATHQAPHFVEDVTTEDGAAYSRYLLTEQGLTFNRHNKLLLTAGVVVKEATNVNPFRDLALYDEKEQTVSHLDLEPKEVLDVIDATNGELRRLLLIGVFTGLRLKDACLLKWDENVRFPANASPVIARRTSKSKKDVMFPIHEWLQQDLLLTPHRERKGYVCPDMARLYESDNQPVISQKVSRVLRKLKLDTRQDRDHGQRRAALRSFHSLRHTFATICADYRIPLEDVQEWLGHSTTKVTAIYQQRKEAHGADEILGALTSALSAKRLPAFVAPTPAAKAPEPERAQLAELSATAPIELVRQALDLLQAGSN